MQGSFLLVLFITGLLTTDALRPNFYGSKFYRNDLDFDSPDFGMNMKRGRLHPLFYHRLSAKVRDVR